MNNTQKPSTLKAVLMCILACLVGALVFGLIYYIGYYVYYITALEIVFGVLAFLKFKQSTSKGNIAIGIIMSTLLVVVFNFAAVFLCDTIIAANEAGLPFNEAFNAMIEIWKTDQEIIAYFNQRLLEISGMALLGCVIAIFMVIGNIKKNKQKQQIEEVQSSTQESFAYCNNQPQTIDNKNENNLNNFEQPTDQNKETSQKVYFEYYTQCKVLVEQYLKDKDMSTFKQNINAIKNSSTQIEPDIKQYVQIIIQKEKNIPNLSNTNRKILEIMERIFG